MKGFIVGIVATVIVALSVTYVGITQGLLIPANADAKPSKLERWMASRSLHATLNREMPREPNPVPATDQNYFDAIKLYGANCAACHGVADAKPSTIAVGLYQHAPQLAKDGVEDDPEGETYWKIEHGIRLTGMPSFGKSLTEEQAWKLALLLKHMDALPPVPKREWKALRNPVALAAKGVP